MLSILFIKEYVEKLLDFHWNAWNRMDRFGSSFARIQRKEVLWKDRITSKMLIFSVILFKNEVFYEFKVKLWIS